MSICRNGMVGKQVGLYYLFFIKPQSKINKIFRPITIYKKLLFSAIHDIKLSHLTLVNKKKTFIHIVVKNHV